MREVRFNDQAPSVASTLHHVPWGKVSDGQSVEVTVPESTTLIAGKLYLLDGYLGVATEGVATGVGQTQKTILQIEQAEYETDQILAGDAFAKGADVFWDAGNNRLTEVAAGHRYAGRVTAAKDANNVIWFILAAQGSDAMRQGAAQVDFVGNDVAALRAECNALLAKLRTAGILNT